jgi:4-amino-4-deoxy-L-arabinose transferase-like glycosyltransferase
MCRSLDIVQSSETLSDSPQPALRNGLFALLTAVLVAIYLSIAFYRISDMPLVDPDEPRYAAAGRTISRPGSSLLVPMFNGEKRINKPPLFYWLVAISDKLCGEASEVSSRLPSIVLGLCMLLGTVYLGSAVYGRTIGLLGGLILSTTPLFMALSRTCVTDMTLSAFMAAALGMLMLGTLRLWPPRPAAWLGAIFLGLAVLTKAHTALSVVLAMCIERAMALPRDARPALLRFIPWIIAAALLCSGLAMYFDAREKKITLDAKHTAAQKSAPDDADDENDAAVNDSAALMNKLDDIFKYASMALILVVVVIVMAMAARAPRGALAEMSWVKGLLLALTMGLWWYLALAKVLGLDEISALIHKEIGQRLAGSMHREPMYYYLYAFAGMSFPWSVGIVLALLAAWPVSAEPESDPFEKRADRFLLAWILGIVLFFSIPGAKLATYILGAMPAFALLTARALQRLAARDATLPKLGIYATAGFTAILACVLLTIAFAGKSLSQHLQDIFAQSPVPMTPAALIVLVLLCGAWIAALRGKSMLCAASLTVSVLVSLAISFPAGMDSLKNRSTRLLSRDIKDKVIDCDRVALLGSEVESLPFYLDRTVPMARRRDVSKNEPYDAVIREEMSRPEKVALCIQRRYFARAIGIKSADFDKLTIEQIVASVPEYASFVATDRSMIVIRNKR